MAIGFNWSDNWVYPPVMVNQQDCQKCLKTKFRDHFSKSVSFLLNLKKEEEIFNDLKEEQKKLMRISFTTHEFSESNRKTHQTAADVVLKICNQETAIIHYKKNNSCYPIIILILDELV
ncbi:MAG: hypothetical protein AAGG81_07160, partial [Chlamydiota bacterium]